MARGRMISNEIARDKRVNDLCDDTSRLAFTWLITFADREGRTYGDPAILRSMLFPRRADVTIEQMERYIREWDACGLALWYEAQGDKWIWFPRFEKHQGGLRKEREAPSTVPAPPIKEEPAAEVPDNSGETPDELRSDDGETPDEIPVNINGIKENIAPDGAEGASLPVDELHNRIPFPGTTALEFEQEPLDPPQDDFVKNPRALAALAGHEARRAAGEADLSFISEYLRDLARAFVEAAGSDYAPRKRDAKAWEKFLQEQDDIGLFPKDIAPAVKYMRENGLTIKGPQSVTAVARDLKARKRDQAEEKFFEEW